MQYQAGAAVRDITPPPELLAAKKIWLWGYGNRTSPCVGVHSRLSARALAIRDQDDNTVVLVALDTGMLAPEMTARVRARATQAFAIPPENICINVSHTHGAPVTVSTPTWQLGAALAQTEYVAFFETQVSRVIEDALNRLQPAQLAWARGNTQIGRDRHFRGELRFYDSTLDVLAVSSACPKPAARSDGRTAIATVFIAPCHPVCNAELNKIYSDFPGVAREAVELELGGTAFFLQGYSGTCVPDLVDGQKATETQTGQRLAVDVIAVARGPKHKLEGPLSAALHSLDLPLQPVDPAALPSIRRWADTIRAAKPDLAEVVVRWTDHLAALAPPWPRWLPTQQQAVRIGTAPNECYVVASSHEVSMDFGPRIRALWPSPRVSVIGYSNAQLSYLPSARVMTNPYAANDFPRDIANYNYTGAVSFLWYAHPGPLAIEADDMFVNGFRSLAEREPPPYGPKATAHPFRAELQI
ncbi:MAG TPA: neutral/alkaline non-lysosomal ceramidase N-terminal domain-containing protein [Stellaceae bacterium]|jgi:hypothetical protein